MARFTRFLIAFLLSPLLVVAFSGQRSTDKFTVLRLDILAPHSNEDIALKKLSDRLTQSIRHSWFVRMPEDAQLGASGVVIIRFQIDRDHSATTVAPTIEQSTAKRKSLTDAALAAVRDATKSAHIPEGVSNSSIEFRAVFFYNQAADSVER